ncbi:hypothetical protein FPQ18DRAFT_338551, partial [Pyronema domesticum]
MLQIWGFTAALFVCTLVHFTAQSWSNQHMMPFELVRLARDCISRQSVSFLDFSSRDGCLVDYGIAGLTAATEHHHTLGLHRVTHQPICSPANCCSKHLLMSVRVNS